MRIRYCVAAFSTGLLYSLARGACWGYFMLVPTVLPSISVKQQFDILLSEWMASCRLFVLIQQETISAILVLFGKVKNIESGTRVRNLCSTYIFRQKAESCDKLWRLKKLVRLLLGSCTAGFCLYGNAFPKLQ